ncbi:hypothetical protein NQ315_000564 [Exocentrus adspersus]|uniref:RNase H type-1 domain-containing protein n=1 Tax=Exocentrus adspersus TaxID=1586481 RepID=A0AAV8VG95_9CUCU|nr:hypothetical protein NQ315_000564 [Exocentrus adspersus]
MNRIGQESISSLAEHVHIIKENNGVKDNVAAAPPPAVKNTQLFVGIIKEQYITQQDLVVSFDVTSLFTNVPTNKALDIVKKKLFQDQNLSFWYSIFLICWYTDGSKTPEGAGAGVYSHRPGVEIADSLGQYATVFQAEIHAIELCQRELEKRGPNRRSIKIFSDSQAALKALSSYRCTSKAVWNCQQTLSRVGRTNRLTLVWIPGHVGLKGNEVADSLARRGAALEFIGPEPVLGLSYSTARSVIRT